MTVERTAVVLEPSQRQAGVDVLTAAFSLYPLIVYAAGKEGRVRPTARAIYQAILSDCLKHGVVHATNDLAGVACWLPPGAGAFTFRRQMEAGLLTLPFRIGLRSVWRLMAYGDIGERLHRAYAPQPHWYLAAIGVAPRYHRQGVAGILLKPILDRADRENSFCYLDTHNPANVRIYERYGFDVVHEVAPPNRPVKAWAMLRRPRPPAK